MPSEAERPGSRAVMREIEARISPLRPREEAGGEEHLRVLSPREREVLKRLLAGQHLKQISEDLSLSVKTVATHLIKVHLPFLVRRTTFPTPAPFPADLHLQFPPAD